MKKTSRKKYLKKGADCLFEGEDCLSKWAKVYILRDKEFKEGLKDGAISFDCVKRLAKELDIDLVDPDTEVAFGQNLAIIAIDKTGKIWWDSGCDGLQLW